MSSVLCPVCDYEIFNDQNEFNYYLISFPKRYDRGLYYRYIIKDVNLNNINKLFDYHINIHNEKFNEYFINCLIETKFDNKIIANLEIINHHNTDYINIENFLKNYKIDNINHMIINIMSCICNIRYKHYKDKAMFMLERRINYIISKYPQLINQNHKIKFNNI